MTRLLTAARLAAASTAVVFVAAFIISWESLRVPALAAGIRELLAPLYPLTIDAVMVTGTVAAVALRAASLRTRLYTWVAPAAGPRCGCGPAPRTPDQPADGTDGRLEIAPDRSYEL